LQNGTLPKPGQELSDSTVTSDGLVNGAEQ
jgi:hypothetical protein